MRGAPASSASWRVRNRTLNSEVKPMFGSALRYAVSAAVLSLPCSVAMAQAPAANPAAPAAADQSGAAAQAAQQFSINQNVGDWVVRCVQTTVKSPAPCEVLQ